MFNSISINYAIERQFGKANILDPRTAKLFDKILLDPSKMLFNRLFGRKSKPILVLEQEASYGVNNRYHAGSKTIAVQDIHGTVDRIGDFDYDFAPMKQATEFRWCKVATAMLQGIDLPPVELIQVGDNYFVKDGHHRISVARALGFTYIDAIVEIWS
jgi:hypothetical protein